VRPVPVERRRLGVLLATMSELTRRPVRTFTIGYPDDGADNELPEAAAIARRFGAEHTEIVLDRDARVPPVAAHHLGHRRSAAGLRVPSDVVPGRVRRARAEGDLDRRGRRRGLRRLRPLSRTPLQRWLQNLVAPGSGGFRTRGQWDRRRTTGRSAPS
jgi:asparagine synthase (glutamine-hydrolysing)